MCSGIDVPQPDIYVQYVRPNVTQCTNTRRYGKGFPNPFVDSLRSKLRLTDRATFRSAFPGTAIPRITMFSGQPRIDKDIFNQLLSSKLATARSVLATTTTPSGLPSLCASWINKILSSLCVKKVTSPPAKKSGLKTEPKVQSTKSFVPPVLPEPQPLAESHAPQIDTSIVTSQPVEPDFAALFLPPAEVKLGLPHLARLKPEVVITTPKLTDSAEVPPPPDVCSDFELRELRLTMRSLSTYLIVHDNRSAQPQCRTVYKYTTDPDYGSVFFDSLSSYSLDHKLITKYYTLLHTCSTRLELPACRRITSDSVTFDFTDRQSKFVDLYNAQFELSLFPLTYDRLRPTIEALITDSLRY